MPASTLAFSLSLNDNDYDIGGFGQPVDDSDTRLMKMLAAQAALRGDGSVTGDEDSIMENHKLSEAEKSAMLQKALHMAASNGDVEHVQRLVRSKAKGYIDINGADEEGTAPLIYASCFVNLSIFILNEVLFLCIPRAIMKSSLLCSMQALR